LNKVNGFQLFSLFAIINGLKGAIPRAGVLIGVVNLIDIVRLESKFWQRQLK
jgi:hypothetical protein